MQNTEENLFVAPISQLVDAGYYRYRPGYAWQRSCMHSSLYHIAEGTMHFTFKDQRITVRKNDVVFVSAGEIAFLESDKACASELYYIAFRADDGALRDRISQVTHSADAASLFRTVVDDYNSGAPLCDLRIASSIYEILYILACDRLRENSEYMQYAEIRKAGEYINKYYYKNITVEELTAVAGYSEAQLRRLFSKVYGCSPKEYILKRKIEHSKRILSEESEKNVEEIAELLGFCSSAYFCSVFKKKCGMSPGEYREAFRTVP